ncbi:MAG TPA: acyloxyacyl hydrolase [Sphingomicrobium sp.]|nr:acyloxyacyl hydrolase [Sphingomicrobium sp.]
MKRIAVPLGLFLATVASAPAQATEVFGGLYVHDIKSPLTQSDFEGGVDVQLGWRGGRIGPTPLQPYAFAALNTAGETNYGAVGLSAKFGRQFYVRPGLGIALHTGSSGNFQRTDRIAFGSRLLFAPELGVGVHLNDRLSVEASWVHMSHGQLFGRQNPGIDNVGVRMNFGF